MNAYERHLPLLLDERDHKAVRNRKKIRRCLSCKAEGGDQVCRTGPDGKRTLCRKCGARYRLGTLPIYQDRFGNPTVVYCPGYRKIPIYGFPSIAQERDLTAPAIWPFPSKDEYWATDEVEVPATSPCRCGRNTDRIRKESTKVKPKAEPEILSERGTQQIQHSLSYNHKLVQRLPAPMEVSGEQEDIISPMVPRSHRQTPKRRPEAGELSVESGKVMDRTNHDSTASKVVAQRHVVNLTTQEVQCASRSRQDVAVTEDKVIVVDDKWTKEPSAQESHSTLGVQKTISKGHARRKQSPSLGIVERRETPTLPVRDVRDVRSVVMKASFRGQMKKVTMFMNAPFSAIRFELTDMFDISERFVVTYKDEDDDTITMSSERDVVEFFKMVRNSATNTVKVLIRTLDD